MHFWIFSEISLVILNIQEFQNYQPYFKMRVYRRVHFNMHFFECDVNNNFLNVFKRVVRFTCKIDFGSVNWQCNLPGWRWATITKVALDRLSRSLHSDVCDSDGCSDAVVHSRISGRGNRRFRAVPNYSKNMLCYFKVGNLMPIKCQNIVSVLVDNFSIF